MLFHLITVTLALGVKIPYPDASTNNLGRRRPDVGTQTDTLGVAIPYGSTEDVQIPYTDASTKNLGVAIPYASEKLGGGMQLFAMTARTRTWSSKAEAMSFFGSSFATVCPQMCAWSDIASNFPGFACPQHLGTSTMTHQHIICQYDGTWARYTASPNNCEFNDAYNCHSAYNNCWNTPSPNCQTWCSCLNYPSSGGGGGMTSRLGSGLLKTQVPVTSVGAAQGTRGSSSCPWWLPAAYEQRDGYQISCNNKKGTFCAFPTQGMNFVCTGYNGIWKIQGGPAPAPTPTPAPQPSQCPGWWYIWSGITRCDREGRFCGYPEHHVNYVCSHGTWQQQGNAPTPPPTQPPVENPVECPADDEEHWLRRGNYCSRPQTYCHYPNGVTWLCNKNGVWTDYKILNEGRRLEDTETPVNHLEAPASAIEL